MRVDRSPLYRRLKSQVRKDDHAELLRMLKLLQKQFDMKGQHGWPGLKCEWLSDAFSWRNSPQGYDYWVELFDRLSAAGHQTREGHPGF
jgi:hypothetical protein